MEKEAYHEDLRGRVHGLLIEVADQLPSTTVELVTELIDANESGVALEMLSEMLVESTAEISPTALLMASDLVDTMRLDRANVDRLRPLVRPSAEEIGSPDEPS